jgi:hypothetical protein
VSPFWPVHWQNGYLPIGDHALVGDGHGSALVGRDAAISWMCVPRFDAPPLFAGCSTPAVAAAFRLIDDVIEADQRYLDDTAVVITTLRTATGICQVTDGFLLHRGARLDHEPTPESTPFCDACTYCPGPHSWPSTSNHAVAPNSAGTGLAGGCARPSSPPWTSTCASSRRPASCSRHWRPGSASTSS